MFIWFVFLIIIVIVFFDRFDLVTKDKADKILDERLAKGEISIEEYNKVKKAKGD